MSRTSRRPSVSPHSGEGREIGLDDREIPGGVNHIGNAETHPDKAVVPARRHVPSINEHRVPDPDPDKPYEIPDRGEKVHVPASPALPEEHYAVPVYQVSAPDKGKVYRDAICEFITVPGPNSTNANPILVCGRDDERIEIRLLNEDQNNDIRFAENPDTLIEGRGTLLWHGTNSYTQVPTQGYLYAFAVTAACQMSVIRITEVAG